MGMLTPVVVILFASYFLVVCWLIAGWKKLAPVAPGDHGTPDNDLWVSVIVAVRNESAQLPLLLHDLRAQSDGHFEVIVIDDHSTDDTVSAYHRIVRDDPRFRLIAATGVGKKSALTQAVSLAKGTLVLATDADCRMGPKWIEIMRVPFNDPGVMCCAGAVAIQGGNFFGSMQSMEFATLVGTGAATVAWNHPTMCNGANLAYRSAAFASVAGYSGNENVPSGDDEFLMNKIHQKFPQSVRCCVHEAALVTTPPLHTFKSFAAQRLRWAGKWSFNTRMPSRILAVYILCFHLCVIVLPIAVITGAVTSMVALGCVAVKLLIEAWWIFALRPIIRTRRYFPAFIALQACYSMYVVIVGLLSQFYVTEWKGRSLKPVAAGNV